MGFFLLLHFFEGESVTCGWLSEFGGFAQLVLVLGLEMITNIWPLKNSTIRCYSKSSGAKRAQEAGVVLHH